MKVNILNFVVCRTPVFTLQDAIENQWENLKKFISNSSPEFYLVIANMTFEEIKTQNEKIQFSVWKYFNRGKYRATPYGCFACISTLSTSKAATSIKILNKPYYQSFRNWEDKDQLFFDENVNNTGNILIRTNSTVYNVGDEFRYIRFANNGFQIEAVPSTSQLTEIIEYCHFAKNKVDFFHYCLSKFKMNKKNFNETIQQLINIELLTTDQQPNIIGQDYFKRLQFHSTNYNSPYIISSRPLISGSLDIQKTSCFTDLVQYLSSILPGSFNSNLSAFKKAFTRKFELQAVPLSIVIDPETGVGYGQLEKIENDSHIANIFSYEEKENDCQITYTKFHSFLLNSMLTKDTIKLETFNHYKSSETVKLPNTMNMMIRFYEGQPVVESVGGCTANTLLGRFTIANEDIYRFCKQIVKLEEEANPDIIFFDIGYQVEKQIDNVNRRKKIYNYEFPILSWSCDQSPISISEIFVLIRDSEIVLWSERFNKRMVPRIPSAYNYTRSDLAVYRFLCDLQHQNIKSDLNFNIQRFFPGLDFYPRITYKEVIVSPAKWKIPHNLINESKLDSKNKIKLWLQNSNINFLFKVGDTDQTLCFDPSIENDLEAFALYCFQYVNKELYISEALISMNDVGDENGNYYASQFIINLSHSNQIYSSHYSFKNMIRQQYREIIFPGGDWIYLEIYCHPVRSNEIIEKLSVYSKDIKLEINYWFFIRYSDPHPHIRLRISLKENSKEILHIKKIKNIFQDQGTIGIISDLQIKTYIPETARYGKERINSVEKLFGIDSEYAVAVLSISKNVEMTYVITLQFMRKLLDCCIGNLIEEVSFAKKIADIFSIEFKLRTENFKKLNLYFKELDNRVKSYKILTKFSNRYLKLAVTILKSCNNDEKVSLLQDLLHMHINRLFPTDQRQHEALLYHFLLKNLKKQQIVSTSLKK